MVIAGLDCPICGSTNVTGDYTYQYAGTEFKVCCNSLLTWVWPSPEAYEAQYTDTEYHINACLDLGLPTQPARFREHKKAGYARLNWLQNNGITKEYSILDIGSSNGALVKAGLGEGWNITGLEPSRYMVDWAWREQSLSLRHGDWKDICSRWDCFVATDVLEHILNPAGFLRHIREYGRYLYIETPDWHNERPRDWKHIKPREHPILYSEQALHQLAQQSGWKSIKVNRPIEGKLAMLWI